MNEDDLRGALRELAGPAVTPGAPVREAIAGRVSRARRRIAAMSSALVVVVAVGAVGVAQSSAFDAQTDHVQAGAVPGRCTKIPPPVARTAVPAAVRRQLTQGAIVGEGSLWTLRRALKQTAAIDGPITRLKIGWFVDPLRADTPPPLLTAREVNGPGRVKGTADRALDARGTWFASTIELKGVNTCWEITAREGSDVIRFRRSTGVG